MRTAAAPGSPSSAGREEDFAAAVAEMAACRARVGVAARPDLAAEIAEPGAMPIMRRLAPGAWVVGDAESAVAVRPVAAGDEARSPGTRAVVLSVIGPRLRRLLRACGASVPPVGFAFRTTVGEVPAWVLTEDREHALVVVAAGDGDACRRALEAAGGPLGCVWAGQTALRHLAAAHVLHLA